MPTLRTNATCSTASRTCLGNVRTWAALDLRGTGSSDLLLLALDDFEPTALEERGAGDDEVRAFFADADHRDRALAGLPATFQARAVDVPDEDWARRSQQDLAPITVGRITVFPTPETFLAGSTASSSAPTALAILILPSMGFGTGHHATTRLCLAALQALDLSDRFVIDVGTGSGVLALASRLLGAREVVGIDYDADAIQSAEESLALNRSVDRVRFALGDLRTVKLPLADVVTANLTGAVITRWGRGLGSMLRPQGTLVISGVQAHERDEVFAALEPSQLVWEAEEDGWIGAIFTLGASPAV
jgi:ribosomal protein L11 methyltransferase